ncbi:hypothetical protein CRENBAI_022637 [Crenichthys baileyi]|uniref:Uncharacterized protein n=1 Tax=Crenichthys baileyi TaxID=28760 RepID=A0AAV9RPV0_9TELE
MIPGLDLGDKKLATLTGRRLARNGNGRVRSDRESPVPAGPSRKSNHAYNSHHAVGQLKLNKNVFSWASPFADNKLHFPACVGSQRLQQKKCLSKQPGGPGL